MSFYEKLSLAHREKYKRRIAKIKKAHPGVRFPSEYHKKMLDINLVGIDGMSDLRHVFPIISRIFCSEVAKKQYAGQALAHAAAIGDLDLCRKLFAEAHAPLDMKDEKGHRSLMNAVRRKRLGVAEYLLEKGAKILPEEDGWNPVLESCANGCIPALNMFKHHGVDFNQTYSCWKKSGKFKLPKKEVLSPFIVACAFKQAKVVQFLLDNGLNVDCPCVGNSSIRDMVVSTPQVFDIETRKVLMQKLNEPSVSITDKTTTISPFAQQKRKIR